MERKFASNGYQTHNHQVMSQIRSPLSYTVGLQEHEQIAWKILWQTEKLLVKVNSSFSTVFSKTVYYICIGTVYYICIGTCANRIENSVENGAIAKALFPTVFSELFKQYL